MDELLVDELLVDELLVDELFDSPIAPLRKVGLL